LKGATINDSLKDIKIPITEELPVFREKKKWITRKSYFSTNTKKEKIPKAEVKPFKTYPDDQKCGLYICHTGNAIIDSRFVLPVKTGPPVSNLNNNSQVTNNLNLGSNSPPLVMGNLIGKMIGMIQSKFTKSSTYFTKPYSEVFTPLSTFLSDVNSFDTTSAHYFSQFEFILHILKTNNKLSAESEYQNKVKSNKDFILIARENLSQFASIYADYFSLIAEDPNSN